MRKLDSNLQVLNDERARYSCTNLTSNFMDVRERDGVYTREQIENEIQKMYYSCKLTWGPCVARVIEDREDGFVNIRGDEELLARCPAHNVSGPFVKLTLSLSKKKIVLFEI